MFTRRFFLKGLSAAAAMLPFTAATGAAAAAPVFSDTRLMMGTFVTVLISGTSDTHAADAAGRAFERMIALESLLTRHRASSPLGQLNAAGSLGDVPPELLAVLEASARMHRVTAGAFDPTVLPLLGVLEQNPESPDARLMAEAAELVGMEHVRMGRNGVRLERSGMMLSLDGIAKGHIADEGARALQAAGVRNFLINAGGDIVARGDKNGLPWRVAVENPEKYEGRGEYPAVIALRDQAIATSGSYENVLNREGTLNHILHPATGRCASIPGVSVTAASAMEADALATALCVMPDPVAFTEGLPRAACLVTLKGGAVRRSSRWA